MNYGIAKSRFVRGSARKYRLIADLIRNKQIDKALNKLYVLENPKLKIPIYKTLKSAIANAEYKVGKAKFERKNFYVVEVKVDVGPVLKRIRGATRSPALIRRRTSHITIKVGEKE